MITQDAVLNYLENHIAKPTGVSRYSFSWPTIDIGPVVSMEAPDNVVQRADAWHVSFDSFSDQYGCFMDLEAIFKP